MDEEVLLEKKIVKMNIVINTKENKEVYGELYCLEKTSQGEWIENIIKRISLIRCCFGELTENRPNGVYIVDEDGELIGNILSSFLIRCYLIKYLDTVDRDGNLVSRLLPINLILDSYNFEKDIKENTLFSIETILNHPYFINSKCISDIEKKLINIKHLNHRFLRY